MTCTRHLSGKPTYRTLWHVHDMVCGYNFWFQAVLLLPVLYQFFPLANLCRTHVSSCFDYIFFWTNQSEPEVRLHKILRNSLPFNIEQGQVVSRLIRSW